MMISPRDGLVHAWSSKGIRIFDAAGKIRWGYSKPVRYIGFSADGKTEVIFFYHSLLMNDKPLNIPIDGFYWPALVSRDGKFIAYGDGTRLSIIKTSGNMDRFLIGHSGGNITAAEFSPDGKHIATGAGHVGIDFAPLYVWDLETRRVQFQGIGSTQPIVALTYSPDGNFIASTGESPEILLWDVKTTRVIRKFVGFTEPVSTLLFSPKGHLLAAGSKDKWICIWDYIDGRLIYEISPKTPKPLDSQISRRDWEVDSEAYIRGAGVMDLAFSLDGNQLVAAYGDRTVTGWDARPLYDSAWVEGQIKARPKRSLEPKKSGPVEKINPLKKFHKDNFVGRWYSSRSGTLIVLTNSFTWSSVTDSGGWSLDEVEGRIDWTYKSQPKAFDYNSIVESTPDHFVLQEMDGSKTTFTRSKY